MPRGAPQQGVVMKGWAGAASPTAPARVCRQGIKRRTHARGIAGAICCPAGRVMKDDGGDDGGAVPVWHRTILLALGERTPTGRRHLGA